MLLKQLLGKKLIFADGGTGTLLQERGLAAGEEPVLWNITHPEEVQSIHQAYFSAGASFVSTNTFGANSYKLSGASFSVEEVIHAGVKLARQAARQQEDTKFVVLDVGPLGQLLKPLGSLSFDAAVAAFKEQIRAGVAAGVDGILIETMVDTYELKAAVLAAQETSELPLIASVAINEYGRLLNGADLRCVSVLLEGLGVDAFGVNCGAGLAEIAPFVEELGSYASLPLILCPNAGLPVVENGNTVYRVDSEAFAESMKPLVEACLAVAGGCCGTSYAHIEALTKISAGIVPKPRPKKQNSWVSSAALSVNLDTPELLIDTRIDLRKNDMLVQTLAKGKLDLVLDEAFDAQAEGAHIIGISMMHPNVDENQTLSAVIEAVQEIVKAPLLITSANLKAFEQALRRYNGAPLVDVSHFSAEEQEAACEIAKRYGALGLPARFSSSPG